MTQTVQFVDKNSSRVPAGLPSSNLPPDKHWVDLVRPDVAVFIHAPPKSNAVVGGIMASRMRQLGAQAVVVNGRVRDVREVSSTLPVGLTGCILLR